MAVAKKRESDKQNNKQQKNFTTETEMKQRTNVIQLYHSLTFPLIKIHQSFNFLHKNFIEFQLQMCFSKRNTFQYKKIVFNSIVFCVFLCLH